MVLRKARSVKPGQTIAVDDEFGNECCFRCATMFPNTEKMFYLNADNDVALRLFDPIFAASNLAETLSDASTGNSTFAVHSAQLIVVNDRSVRHSKWHQDYGASDCHTMYSAICALFPLPDGAGGLEFRPWGCEEDETHCAGAAQVADYDEGCLVVFDGNLTHRTQPYNDAAGPRILAVMDCYGVGDSEAQKLVARERGNGYSRTFSECE